MTGRSGKLVFSSVAIAGVAFFIGRGSTLLGGESVAQANPLQDTGAAAAQDPAQDPMMQAYVDAGTPGDHHKRLEVLIGEFDAHVKMWMEPDSAPMESPGTVTREWVLGGRYVKETVKAETPFGPFEGIGYIGYNNINQQYEMVWLENMSTAMYYETGVFATDDEKYIFMGSHREPGGAVKFSWSEMDVSDADTHTVIGYSTDSNGNPFKMFEGEFTRKN